MASLISYFSHHRWPAIFWTLLMMLAFSWPGDSLPDAPVVGFDKVVHIGLFAGWALLWMMLFPKRIPWLIFLGITFGILIEFYQQLLPFDRTFDWWDAVADGIGTLLGAGLFLIFTKKAERGFGKRRS